MSKTGSLLGATLLISGCAIGAGTVVLPVVSAAAGFIPTILAMILAYFFAVITGLYFMEVVLWYQEKTHLTTLAKFALGKTGKYLAWSFFLFLFYCLFVAYIEGGGKLFSSILSYLLNTEIAREAGIFLFVFAISSFVYFGAHAVSIVSRLFMLGAVIAYGALVALGLPSVKGEALLHMNWNAVYATIPVLLICFGYHILVPTLVTYVNRDVNLLKKAIWIGNLIPFLVYLLWDFVILGILPEMSETTLASIVDKGSLVTGLLQKASKSTSILFFAGAFSLFALLTPFMACSLAFVDFLKDGLKSFPKAQKELVLFMLVFTPPTILSILYPNLFIEAISLAGGFIDVVLFGIIPLLIVWIGRYKKNKLGPYRTFGGKPLLLSTILFCFLVLGYRISEFF